MTPTIEFNDQSQRFIPESLWMIRGWMDELPRLYVSFDEYLKLIFAGTPGEFIVKGI